MENKHRFLLFSVILLLLLSACQPAPSSPAGLKVIAIETFLGDIAQNVAGDRAWVDTLIPIGVDPHSFEPAPQDVAKLAEAQLILANGAGFETWLQRTLDNAGSRAGVIEASAGLKPRTAREGEVAEMSDADLTDAICADASQEKVQPAPASASPASAAALPAETGLYALPLAPASGGGYAGSVSYTSDESGDFQFAFSAGSLAVSGPGGSLAPSKTLPLACSGLAQALIVRLDKNTPYTLSLSGQPSPQASLLTGPAGGVHHHDTDPHFWLDPNNVLTYVENIRAALTQADPAGAAVYTANAAAYAARLKDLDAWIVTQVAVLPPARRLLVTNHESFGYFADRYGFRITGTVIPSVSSDASPSAQQLARLVDRIRAAQAPAIFLEAGANSQLADQVGRETGVKVVTGLYTHSITAPGGGAPTYIDMLKFDVTAIVGALK